MTEYHELLRARIRQFTYYLQLMRERQSKISSGNSYIIFDERLLDSGDQVELTKAAAAVLAAVDEYFVRGGDADGPYQRVDLPAEGWREDDSGHRFVQFSFNPKYFDMDIPNTTLYRAEANEILRSRSGFFYVTDRPEFEHPEENAARFNPLRKAYVYGDEVAAAEDMAYVFFHVWRFPVDWRFYVSASAFHEHTNWEDYHPLECAS